MKQIPFNEQLNMCKQISSLLSKGLSLSKALQISRVPQGMIDKVNNGEDISKAFTGYFSNKIILLVSLGVKCGNLDKMLNIAWKELKAEKELISSISRALSYPVIVLITSVFSLIFFVSYIIPQMLFIFGSLGVNPPILLIILVNIFKRIPLFIVPVTLTLVILAYYFKGRNIAEEFLMRLPLAKEIYRYVNNANIARSLSFLMTSGIGVNQSIEETLPTINSKIYKKALFNVNERIKNGEKISEAFESESVFVRDFVQMINVGEEAGMLEDMMENASSHLSEEALCKIRSFATIIEPASTIFVGAIVMSLAIIMLMPITQLLNNL